MIRICTALLLGALLVACEARAQPSAQPGPQARGFFFIEAVPFAPDDSVDARIDILYRIDTDFFVSVRSSGGSGAGTFRRRGQIIADLLDSTGLPSAHGVHSIDLADDVSERPPTDIRWHKGLFSFRVPPGRYSVSVEAIDNESHRTFVEKERSVVAGTSAGPGALASWLFLGDSIAQPLPGHVSPHTYGGDILFRTQVTLYAELPAGPADTSAVDVEYAFAHPESHGESEPAHNGVLKGLQPVAGIILRPPGGEDSTSYEISSGHVRPAISLFVPLPTQGLPLRLFTFSMTLRQGSRTFTLSRPVRLVWPEMPLSLRNVDFALDALRFLVSESQLDSLRDGDFDTRVRNLERFWDARDLRPETPTNEAMVQYYRRVDHAVTAFATLRQPDGLRSDRAKIYVLYGPPTKTERSLDPQSGFREVWVYERLNRRFTFVDRTRSGTYTLESTSP